MSASGMNHGDECGLNWCTGTLRARGCSCHLGHAPCSACERGDLRCDACGDELFPIDHPLLDEHTSSDEAS